LFTKLGWAETHGTSVHVTGAYADNELIGNALQEQRLLACLTTASVYTTPDITDNWATFGQRDDPA
jgi:hypothetical protein